MLTPEKVQFPQSSRALILVRHGEAENNVMNVLSSDLNRFHLTAVGREAADRLGRELSKLVRIDRLYTSPVLRAVETANLISAHIGLKPETNKLLIERSFGGMNGKKVDPEERMEVIQDQITRGYPDWESYPSMKKRMLDFFELLRTGEVTVAVTHRGPLKAAIGHFLHKDMEDRDLIGLNLRKGGMTTLNLNGHNLSETVLAIDNIALPVDVIYLLERHRRN